MLIPPMGTPSTHKRRCENCPRPETLLDDLAFRELGVALRGEIVNMDRLPVNDGAAAYPATGDWAFRLASVSGLCSVGGHSPSEIALDTNNLSINCVTESRRVFGDHIEHGLNVRRRAGDDPKNLSLWPFAVPTTSVSSLNNRTFSIAMTAWSAKVLSRAICLSVKWPYLRAADRNRSDRNAFSQQWRGKDSSSASNVAEWPWIPETQFRSLLRRHGRESFVGRPRLGQLGKPRLTGNDSIGGTVSDQTVLPPEGRYQLHDRPERPMRRIAGRHSRRQRLTQVEYPSAS